MINAKVFHDLIGRMPSLTRTRHRRSLTIFSPPKLMAALALANHNAIVFL